MGPDLLVQHTYRLGELLYTRGVARGYRALDVSLEDEVVLEHVQGGGEDRREFLAQYRSVVVKVMRLRHPNLVAIRDFAAEEGGWSVVRQYDPGKTLDALLRDPLDESARVEVCKGILRGLGALHRARMLHRDVKPNAVYVVEGVEPRAQLDGFHLAVSADREYVEEALCGTPIYLAPELCGTESPRVYSRGSDIYAAGLVALEVLSGRPLLDLIRASGLAIPHPAALLERVRTRGRAIDEPVVRGAVAEPYAELILRATHPDPRERFLDGQAFFESFALSAPPRLARDDDPTAPDTLTAALDRLPSDEARSDLVNAYRIMSIDARMALAKCRQIAEAIAERLYSEAIGDPRGKRLYDLTSDLNERGHIPPEVYTHFNNVRKQGNLGVHGGDAVLSLDGVLTTIGATVRIVSWYLVDRGAGGST